MLEQIINLLSIFYLNQNFYGRLKRWYLVLSRLDINFQYSPGKKNVVAYALSRRIHVLYIIPKVHPVHTYKCDSTVRTEPNAMACSSSTIQLIKSENEKDSHAQKLIQTFTTGKLAPDLIPLKEHFQLHHGILYYSTSPSCWDNAIIFVAR